MHKSYVHRLSIVVWLALFVLRCGAIAQDHSTTVDWMTIEEAIKANKEDKQKIFIDMYTDWCGWCKKMDKVTFQDPDIANYLNEYFHPVKFDAESRRDITYKGKTYQFVDKGKRGYHELAAAFSQSLGRLSYPTIVFIDEELNIIQPIAGFQDAQSFEVMMTYIAEDHYKSTPWKKYHAQYVSENFKK